MMKSIRMLILLMCHYQDVQSRVQAEIDDVIGTRATPSSNHRKDMPYTQAVILEMLRYVSQTPLAIPHKCNKDVVLDGYLIEKDTGVRARTFLYYVLTSGHFHEKLKSTFICFSLLIRKYYHMTNAANKITHW